MVDAPSGPTIFRVGINLGDVALVDGDVYGDGVNVAARPEHLAEPGGVVVSGTAYDHLQGKLAWPLDFAGEQQVRAKRSCSSIDGLLTSKLTRRASPWQRSQLIV